jgi:TolB-like protein/Flp pilus assembly protein TadD
MTKEGWKRKLTALLSADVEGYSRLMGDDEEATILTLTSYRKVMTALIQQHGGRVVDSPGDNLLAEFASAVDAVQGAVAIQRELKTRNAELPPNRQMEYRIGINVGDVVVEGERIYGDGVNIAARLESLADGGGICISGTTYDQVKNKLSLGYEYQGEQTVKNITDPVRVYKIGRKSETAISSMSEEQAAMHPVPEKPSLAVLPFINMSRDPEQEYFSDGMTEDIITALSRIRWFFIIARNSTFAYKGHSVDVRKVAKELGVRYVLEGSVRKAGSRVRVTAQLIDGDTGKHVWANRYDREFDDVFSVQDELTETIVGALDPELGKAERERAKAKRPENLDAWDVYQRGLWHLYHYTKEDIEKAQKLFRQATLLDPNLGVAFSGLAEAFYFSLVYGHSDTPEHDREEALVAARTAVELDGEDAVAHSTLGRIYYVRREHDLAIAELQTALELNPSLAWAHYGVGAALVFSGRAREALPFLQTAMKLSPRDPNMGSFLVRMADAYLFMRNYDEAIAWAKKALRQQGFQWSRYAVLVSALGHLGRLEEANRALQELRTRRSDFSIEFVQATHIIADAYDMSHYLDGLRKASVT